MACSAANENKVQFPLGRQRRHFKTPPPSLFDRPPHADASSRTTSNEGGDKRENQGPGPGRAGGLHTSGTLKQRPPVGSGGPPVLHPGRSS